MTKHPTFTPGACYDRDGTLMVEVKPNVHVNETTARLKHGIMPKKADKGGHHGPTQEA